MPHETPTWQRHLHTSTQKAKNARAVLEGARYNALTVLCHPDPCRVGERAVLLGDSSLSRLEPLFAQPRGRAPRPLADPCLSRSPLEITVADDAVVLDPSQSSIPVLVDGEPLTTPRSFDADALENGVVLVLAERVALLLHAFADHPPTEQDHGLVGESSAVTHLRHEIERVAGLDFSVLLRGESGTGKELAARALHKASSRRGRPFVAVNMGAVPPSLAAAELFGAAKGAYSGADKRRVGYFEQARGGTLFLDEIGETPPDVQVLLLRALESGQVQGIGARKPEEIDVRIVSATDVDLEAAMAAGEMRSPLFHRLASYEIVLPPLRERRDDLGRLFFHFLAAELADLEASELLAPDREPPFVPAALVARLAEYSWPGNVRQLRNVARQLAVGNRDRQEMALLPRVEGLLSSKEPVEEESEPTPTSTPLPAPVYRDPHTLDEAELRKALREQRYEIKAAAKALGVSRTSLYERMEHFGLPKASTLERGAIERRLAECEGDLDAAAQELEVSKPALKRRMGELGLR